MNNKEVKLLTSGDRKFEQLKAIMKKRAMEMINKRFKQKQ